MKVSDVKSQVERIIGMEIAEDHFLELVNECIRENLVDILRLETLATSDLTEDSSKISCPEDLFKILQVKALSGGILDQVNLDREGSIGYQVFGKVIFLQGITLPNTLELWYHRYPREVINLGATPDFPAQFHHALKYYVLARLQQEDEELELQQDYWNEFYKIRQVIDEHTQKYSGSHRPSRMNFELW